MLNRKEKSKFNVIKEKYKKKKEISEKRQFVFGQNPNHMGEKKKKLLFTCNVKAKNRI